MNYKKLLRIVFENQDGIGLETLGDPPDLLGLLLNKYESSKEKPPSINFILAEFKATSDELAEALFFGDFIVEGSPLKRKSILMEWLMRKIEVELHRVEEEEEELPF